MSSSLVNWDPYTLSYALLYSPGSPLHTGLCFAGLWCARKVPHGLCPMVGVSSHAAVWRRTPCLTCRKHSLSILENNGKEEKHSLEAEMGCKEASSLLGSAARNGAHSHGKMCSKGWIVEARVPEA